MQYISDHIKILLNVINCFVVYLSNCITEQIKINYLLILLYYDVLCFQCSSNDIIYVTVNQLIKVIL